MVDCIVLARADYAYLDHKSSPYHTGTLRTRWPHCVMLCCNVLSCSVRGLPDERTGRLDQNYMMVRAQSRLQDGYDRLSHRSDSRNDLLDTDTAGHNIYEHGLYYQPGKNC